VRYSQPLALEEGLLMTVPTDGTASPDERKAAIARAFRI
jgi:hypothetical protein